MAGDPTVGVHSSVLRDYDDRAPGPDETATATFGLGCFWTPDGRFGAVDGVVRTRVGYAGGRRDDPRYHALGDHTEVVQADYLPDVLDYRDLLEVAFRSHDPRTTVGKRQYRNVVLHHGPDQKRALAAFLADRGLDRASMGTDVEPLDRFHLAESYHQKYGLGSTPSLAEAFETAGYDDAALRESPAAAKLNGHALGEDLPEGHELAVALERA